MGFNELLTTLRALSPEERAIIRDEIDKMETGFAHHGLTEKQWEKIKKTQTLLSEGKMKTRPAHEVMAEVMKRYE